MHAKKSEQIEYIPVWSFIYITSSSTSTGMIELSAGYIEHLDMLFSLTDTQNTKIFFFRIFSCHARTTVK